MLDRVSGEPTANTALIDGVRKFAMDVRELDIDLIDRINPFKEAYPARPSACRAASVLAHISPSFTCDP
jgi:hypothetical protein